MSADPWGPRSPRARLWIAALVIGFVFALYLAANGYGTEG